MPAHSVIWLFLVDSLHAPLDPIYNEALKREIDKIAAAIPHDELAIRFDVASAVFARLERNEASSYGRTKAEMQDTFGAILVDLGNRVPADIDLLYHLCYGNSGHRHVIEPTDMADMVDFANRLSRQIERPCSSFTCRCRATAPTTPISRRCGSSSCSRNRIMPWAGSPYRRRRRQQAAARRGADTPEISPSRPNAALAGAIQGLLRNCCIHAAVADLD